MTCYFEFWLAGAAVIVGFWWLTLRSIRNGVCGFFEIYPMIREENPFGFWSTIFASCLLFVAILALLWGIAPNVCARSLTL